jgi:phenylalanine-4-hydroxylase
MTTDEDRFIIKDPDPWHALTETDHEVWRTLFARQKIILQERAAPEFFEGLQLLRLDENRIPKFDDLSQALYDSTKFRPIPVPCLIPDELFFKLVASRRFPTTCFIRRPDQLDYLQEPDIFHDVFGHLPLLAHPVFSDFMQLFGEKGVEACQMGLLKFAGRLYWFTVEFGLIKTQLGNRIYGSGILSSKGESIYCVDSDIPQREPFDLIKIMKTDYRIDVFQTHYYVIENYETLFNAIQKLDWHAIKDELLESENESNNTKPS